MAMQELNMDRLCKYIIVGLGREKNQLEVYYSRLWL